MLSPKTAFALAQVILLAGVATAAVPRGDHPRMFFNRETWPAVKARAEGPARAAREALVARARGYTDNPVCSGTEPVTTPWWEPIPPIREFAVEAAECALAWRFTGEKAFLEKARRMLVANGRGYREAYRNRRAVNWYAVTRTLSLTAYDWIYEGLTDAQRREIIVPLVEHVEEVQPGPGRPAIVRRNASGPTDGFYSVRSLLWYSGLAAYGDGHCDALAAKHLEEGERLMREMLAIRERIAGADGGLASAVPVYALGAYPWAHFNFFHTYLSAMGRNLAADYPGLGLLPDWIFWAWMTAADGKPVQDGFGDDYHVLNEMPTELLYQHLTQQIFFYGKLNPESARLAATIRERVANRNLVVPGRFGDWPMYAFILPCETDAKPHSDAEIAAFPEKARRFTNLGRFYLRSGWDADSTYATFTAGAGVSTHKHYDENAFVIRKHDFLAIDAGSRANETDAQLRHYYSQTVAHNAILIHRPGEAIPPYWGPEDKSPEAKLGYGGQIRASATVLAFETTSNYTYIASDATRAYGAKCREAVRQFVHLQPDFFVVYDRVESAEPGDRKEFLLHTVNEPEIDGAVARADCGRGRLFCETLLPADAEIRKVGGPGREYWSAGRNWELDPKFLAHAAETAKASGHGPYFGAWRLEVAPRERAAATRFLHVLTAADTTRARGVRTVRLRDGERDGVEVTLPDGRKALVWFNRAGKVGCEVKFTRFAPIALKGLGPRPDFWKVRPHEIMELCEGAKRASRKEIVCRTPLGYPVYALFYGDFGDEPPRSNWSAGKSSRTYRSYYGDRTDGRQTFLFLCGIHGAEPENVAAAANLIQMLETGRDFRGRTDAELLDLVSRYRLIVVPCANMDGRSISPDHLRGMRWTAFRSASQGTWKDGSLIGWRGSKDWFPLPVERVGYPGGYPNAEGYNIMHDATPGDLRTAEAEAILRLCSRWRVDAALNGHSYEWKPSVLRPCFAGSPALLRRAAAIRKRANDAIRAAGLTDWVQPEEEATADFNLNALMTYASGALVLTLESAVSAGGRVDDDAANPPEPYSFDDIMKPAFIVLKEFLKDGLVRPFLVRGDETVRGD